MLLGNVAMHINPIKNNLGTRISTKADIVSVDDHMPCILCSMQFPEFQGYII